MNNKTHIFAVVVLALVLVFGASAVHAQEIEGEIEIDATTTDEMVAEDDATTTDEEDTLDEVLDDEEETATDTDEATEASFPWLWIIIGVLVLLVIWRIVAGRSTTTTNV